MPGLPDGKPAGMRCPHLDADFRCALFGRPERPSVCGAFMADPTVCGASQQQALLTLAWLENVTAVS